MQHPGVRETAPSLGSCFGNRLPAWVSIWVSLVSPSFAFTFFSLLSINYITMTICLCNRPFWLLVRSIYDSFKYQGLVILLTPPSCSKYQPFFQTFSLFLICIFFQKFSVFFICIFSGIFSIFHLHRPDQRHDLLPIYPCPLVVLRSKHLRLGAVCVAHR